MVPEPRNDNRIDAKDRWLPPKRQGSNVPLILQGQQTAVNLIFYHDETTGRTTPMNQAAVANYRERFAHYKTYSMYHARGVLMAVDCDATLRMVGDGKHEADDDDNESLSESDDDGPYDDWTELTFGSANVGGQPSLSYVGCRGRERRMAAQRRGQDWVHHLVPDRYQSRISATDNRPGGLVGELPLLIGLVAMSLPTTMWPTLLPRTIANQWQISQEQLNNIERGSQCKSCSSCRRERH